MAFLILLTRQLHMESTTGTVMSTKSVVMRIVSTRTRAVITVRNGVLMAVTTFYGMLENVVERHANLSRRRQS